MTYKEALESLEYLKSEIKCHYPVEYPNDYDYSIEKAIYAIKKQIPKKPKTDKKTVDFGNGYSVKIVEIHTCPSCGKKIMRGCRCHWEDCGQKIDWSDD